MPRISLKTVEIHGFRGLRQLRLEDMDLINILVGSNDSGKTSVLEAISILCDPLDPYEWLSMISRRDFGRLDETRIESLRWCFEQHGELADPDMTFEGECEMRCFGAFPVRKLVAVYKDLLGGPEPAIAERTDLFLRSRQASRGRAEPWRGAEIEHHVEIDSLPQQGAVFGGSGQVTIEPVHMQVWEGFPAVRRASKRRPRVASATLTPYSYQINRIQAKSLSRQLMSGHRALTLDLVRRFDIDVEDIAIVSLMEGGRPAIYLKHRRLGPAPLSVFGDALRRAVLLASTVTELSGGGVLLIDELETGIHVSNLDRVFSWLMGVARQLQVQVVATTHSLEAVDAVALSAGEAIGDLVTFHLDQSDEETHARRIPGELLLRIRRERGLDVR